MSTGIFDQLDEEADNHLFDDLEKPSGDRDTTPEFFGKVDPSGEMSLFSPSKPKNSLFDFDEHEKKVEDEKGLFNDDDDEIVDKEPDPKEKPLGFLQDEDLDDQTDNKEDEDFELIDSSEVPSVEEAERQLEIARQESERRKREEEREQKEEEENELAENERDNGKEEEEVTDGGAFSRALGLSDPPQVKEDPLIATEEVEEVESSKNDEVIQELQQQISELTSNLESAQSENASLHSEVSELREQLEEERQKNKKLEEELKKKDDEITSLKESSAAAAKPPKPSPSRSKPTLAATSKQPSVTSPRTSSARLKQDTEKKSVAETAKRFGQTEKKPSPSKKSSVTKKESSADSPKISRQDTATSRKPSTESHPGSSTSTSDKKSSSPPKPSRTKARPQAKPEDSPMISTKPQRNTLDAIKLWEQKTGDKKDTSPTFVKKPLSSVNSTPTLTSSNDVAAEHEEENVPPPTVVESSTDSSSEKNGEEKPVEGPAEQKSPLRQGGTTNTETRKKNTESMIIPGSKSKRWNPPTVDKCQVCKKTVYPLERLQADEKVYHKTCFRCTHCKKVVGLGTYAANKGEIFCKTHFKMLFKMKGNYDEGFGREQHKRRWNNKGTPSDEPTEE